MPNKVFMGEDGIIRNINLGDITEESVRKADKEIRELTKEIPMENRRLLVDFRPTSKTSPGARKAYTEAAKSGVVPKIAVLVGSIYQRVLASFILRISGARDVKVFSDEEKALEWLKE